MIRRRYRLFIVVAIIMVFMLYRASQNSWPEPAGYGNLRPPPKPDPVPDQKSDPLPVHAPEPLPPKPLVPTKDVPIEDDLDEALVERPPEIPKGPIDAPFTDIETPKKLDPVIEDTQPGGVPPKVKAPPEADPDAVVHVPKLEDIADSDKGALLLDTESSSHATTDYDDAAPLAPTRVEPDTKQPHAVEEAENLVPPDLHWKNPPKDTKDSMKNKEPKQHWERPTENFPLPPESITPVPSGTPKKIPQIQYDFGTESEQAKTKRLQRQSRVKAELTRAWSGYRQNAWMHDELSPVSNKYRDPFCGWAATLVDSLDTLWIAGMKEEFDEAAKAVKDIDFTWSPRHDIPVFETTIRYLGGLVAAYDVSGGHRGDYPVLLEKAIELAEILMGIFDTPNRMPILFYRWQPPFSSQPHRAGTVGIAELGTLSMEFTRLAQLTHQNKYYDAVDRITDALIEMQKVGTVIPGLFPTNLDASGCNRTAATNKLSLSKQAQEQFDSDELLEEPVGYVGSSQKDSSDGSLDFKAGSFASSKDQESAEDIFEDNLTGSGAKTGGVASTSQGGKGMADDRIERRMVPPTGTDPEDDQLEAEEDDVAYVPPVSQRKSERRPPFAADGHTMDWDCEPQGLIPAGYGHSTFHMGGAQDSAYEYFPKQYLLLGGLEPKYKKLHVDAIDAVYDWLLYRPMIKDEGWDILFSAKIDTAGNPEKDMIPTFETTHLTCFIGGMFGLGGKIFNRERDVEIAKKLTDGCVWAYQATASGIMPESAHIMPCPSLEKCEFNETKWWLELDPSKDWRERQMARWEADEAERKLAEEEIAAAKAQDNYGAGKASKQEVPGYSIYSDDTLQNLDVDVNDGPHMPESYPRDVEERQNGNTAVDTKAGNLQKREALLPANPRAVPPTTLATEKLEQDDEPGSSLPDSLKSKLDLSSEDPKAQTKAQPADEAVAKPVDVVAGTRKKSKGLPKLDQKVDDVKPSRTIPAFHGAGQLGIPQKPMTHEEFVRAKIEKEKIPPGYTTIASRGYILRPEAIESVWYMYRITGDPSWMDKGWQMFEATVAATRTEHANSAIDDVLSNSPHVKDEMESFWIAETLKYYYLLFSEPDLISLDEWVLNTEAHPFRRPS